MGQRPFPLAWGQAYGAVRTGGLGGVPPKRHINLPGLLGRRVPEECPQEVADLIKQCLDVDPEKRPSAEACIRRLQALPDQRPLLGSL